MSKNPWQGSLRGFQVKTSGVLFYVKKLNRNIWWKIKVYNSVNKWYDIYTNVKCGGEVNE